MIDIHPRTRTIESVGDFGRWQAQYFDKGAELWYDIGDSTATYEDARAKETAYRNGTWGHSSENTRKVMQGLDMSTPDDGSMFIRQSAHDPDRITLSVTPVGWTDNDVTPEVELDTSDLLRIMAWGVQYLAEKQAGY